MSMKSKAPGKRAAGSKQKTSSKKQKLSHEEAAKSRAKNKGKEHAFDRAYIPIPYANDSSDDGELSEQDLELLQDSVSARSFLRDLDEKAISRSKKEAERLHKLTKPASRPAPVKYDLPSIDSHSEDEESWSSGIDETASVASPVDEYALDSADEAGPSRKPEYDSDEEMPYERMPRRRQGSHTSEEAKAIERLPIKLKDGRVQRNREKVIPRNAPESSSESEEENAPREAQHQKPTVEDVATGARFGRPAVVDIVSQSSRKARVHAAKEQISSICQDIVADPENSLGLLRRLHTFSLAQISTPKHPEPVANDDIIRKLAFLSQLAVFRDIIPGYRIRSLTEKEKAEKVSQLVQRTRDFEQGLVSVYQAYLRNLETELKANSELADTALQCICRLLIDVTHFNFRVNLMSAIVARLSRKSWNEQSQLCLDTLISVLREDNSGEPSLEIVRLLNRMIKERRFNVHPNVLFCLLHLRLKTELFGVRASSSKSDKEKPADHMSKSKAAARRAKGKPTSQPHLSKKVRKNLKETQVIEEEMREAEAEVDQEERAAAQTETLKLLFVLYFRILKNEKPTPLLPAALQGISRFAHLVNIDFFKDLLQVLREHVSRGVAEDDSGETQDDDAELQPDVREAHRRLLCIVTAFELLTGQGEALNIDLSDFLNYLYAMILPLSIMHGIETPVPGTTDPSTRSSKLSSKKSAQQPPLGDTPANMLFRALTLAFSPRVPSFAKPPPWRTAAFAKRLATAALHFPPASALHALEFAQTLIAREPRADALLATEDRIADGVYRADVDDPQLCNPFAASLWELHPLEHSHVRAEVRQLARELASFTRDGV